MLRVHATMLLRKTLIPSTVTSEPNPNGLHKKSNKSAKGAKYESQGQARSEAERVAPGERKTI
jgi:hypothetical protein